jgi:hypothetical protein
MSKVNIKMLSLVLAYGREAYTGRTQKGGHAIDTNEGIGKRVRLFEFTQTGDNVGEVGE